VGNEELGEQKSGDILVVDDNPANLKLLTDLLQSEGYSVRPANSGELALLSARVKLPDLILMDVLLGDQDGVEICRILKSDPKTQDCSVIFISGLDEPAERLKAFAAGGSDYILKPFHHKELLGRVKVHAELRELQKRIAHLESENQELKLQLEHCTSKW